MSSKGRGPRIGGKDDVYLTPLWCLDALIVNDKFFSSLRMRQGFDNLRPVTNLCVEPACGDFRLAERWNEYWPFSSWRGYDIRPLDYESLSSIGKFSCCDFLTVNKGSRKVELVLTNPPYSLAEKFIRRSRALYPCANIVMLLRMGFLASSKRTAFYQDLGMPDVYVLPNRPSFSGKGTDSSDYAWFVWPFRERWEDKLSFSRLYRLEPIDQQTRRDRS